MPYLHDSIKEVLNEPIDSLASRIVDLVLGAEDDDQAMAEAGGMLNYCFNMLALHILETVPAQTRYAHLERLLGTFNAAKLEFWWKVVRPYEDMKITENGDVY